MTPANESAQPLGDGGAQLPSGEAPHYSSASLAEAVRATARRAYDLGHVPLPAKADGSKRPDLASWREYQHERPPRSAVEDWFAEPRDGLLLVMGEVSLTETMEFDDPDTLVKFRVAARDAGLGDLVSRLDAGYSERSPGDGLHWPFHHDKPLANTPLGRRPCPDPRTCRKHAQLYAEQGQNRRYVDVLIETRGEGGVVVVAPSAGGTHPTGRAYELIGGDLQTIPKLTTSERDALYDLARTFDEMPVPLPREPSGRPADGTRPGDEWAAHTSWAELMERNGFRIDSRRGEEEFWTRPGKREGVSATTNYRGSDLLYVFSTSIGGLEPEATYTKFGALAALEYGGDYAAAAKALALLRFGSPSAGPTARGAPPLDGTRARTGGAFVLDTPMKAPSLLGTDDAVLHAQGEALLLVGPDGVGKSTLAQRYTLATVGLGEPTLLGLDVRPVDGRVVYLAMDRPHQIARSLRRMVGEADREILDEHLTVWPGPLPVDLLADPRSLLPWVRSLGTDIERVVVDSLKDVILGLSEDKSGAAWNLARQDLLAGGIEVVEIHHQRKEQRGTGAGKPKKLADVYGSRWITAGAGSVVLLWGEPGDPVVEFIHLKQPALEVGPFRVLHDQATGTMTVFDRVDVLHLVNAAPRGLAVADAARAIFETSTPSPSQIEKARRQLQALATRGVAVERPVAGTERGGKPVSLFFGITLVEQSRGNHAGPPAEPITAPSNNHAKRPPQVQESNHAANHGNHAGGNHVSAPL